MQNDDFVILFEEGDYEPCYPHELAPGDLAVIVGCHQTDPYARVGMVVQGNCLGRIGEVGGEGQLFIEPHEMEGWTLRRLRPGDRLINRRDHAANAVPQN